ncbi:BadF/BadG/BcrA/BcrD ATPase family protein [Leifsonia lichenia]
MSTEAVPSHIAVDLGKTNCRVRIDDGRASTELRGAGFPGLAAAGGAALAIDAIAPLVSSLGQDRLSGVAELAVGAAGADSDRDAARTAALRARELWGFGVTIASDVLTAHIGAFAGAAGTVLIAGTGAVAFHVAAHGAAERSDGWGPWLGDEGSGRWIGQAGLIAALRSSDRRGQRTALEEDARDIAGDLTGLPRTIMGGHDVARSLASFAPTVLRRAAAGDEVAQAIVDAAVGHLVTTASSVAAPGSPVSVIGGLTDDPEFLRLLLDELASRELSPRRPAGSSLDGAAILAVRRDLPHERYAIRV